jgi:hypothetical protein
VITAAFSAAAPSMGRSTEAAEGAVRFKSRADGGDQCVEGAGPAGARLDNDLQLGAVLVIIAQGRQRDLWIAGLAITQDD